MAKGHVSMKCRASDLVQFTLEVWDDAKEGEPAQVEWSLYRHHEGDEETKAASGSEDSFDAAKVAGLRALEMWCGRGASFGDDEGSAFVARGSADDRAAGGEG